MIEAISSKWWMFLLRGIAALIVAVVAFAQPSAALIALVIVLGFYAFVGGALILTAGIVGVGGNHWWAVILEGLLGIAIALLIWIWPLESTVAFVYFVASWLILTGVVQVAAGIRLRDLVPNEWLYILSGIVSIVFGAWVFRYPAQGLIATAFLFGWYFALFGILQVAVAFKLRSLGGMVAKAA